MYKATIIVFVLLFFSSMQGKAQQKDFAYYDSLTYKLYLDKDYKQLLKVGKEALHLGLDYYYLRMRTGIAAYNLKKYRIASMHFEKAATFSVNDIVHEYLYYSSLWGGEPLKARKTLEGMSDALKVRVGFSEKDILATDVGMAILNQAEDFPNDFDFPEQEGTQLIPTQFLNMSLSLMHGLGGKANMTHTFTYLHKSNDKYTFNNNQEYYDTEFKTNQYQYYMGSAISLGRSWNLYLGGHISAVSFPEYSEYGYVGSNQFIKSTSWHQDYVFSASVLKNFTHASIEGEMVLMSMNGVFSSQPTAILRFYPLANLNLYTQSQFSYLTKNSSGTYFQQQKIGFKVLRRLWLEANYFSGDVSGFTLNNGAMLFNGPEEINRMAGGVIIIPTSPNFTLTLGYQNRVQSNYYMQDYDVNLKSNILELNYSLLFILLSWTL